MRLAMITMMTWKSRQQLPPPVPLDCKEGELPQRSAGLWVERTEAVRGEGVVSPAPREGRAGPCGRSFATMSTEIQGRLWLLAWW